MEERARVAVDERFGRRATLEEIEVGAELGPVEWSITGEDLDRYCMANNEFHEWYTVDSPFGGRVASISSTYQVARRTFMEKYWVRGLFVGWSNEQLDVIHVGRKYTWKGRVTDKYQKRDREWVWFEFVCTDEEGREVVRTRRGHVLDYLPISVPKVAVSQGFATEDEKLPEVESRYLPPGLNPKKAEELLRTPGIPVSDVRTASSHTALGTELTPISHQLTWRYNRDYYELVHTPGLNFHPKWWRARNIHTDLEFARREGLDAPNSLGPQPAAQIFSMMLRFLGQGWLKGGKFDLRFTRQMPIEDFVTAKGILTGKYLEGDAVRLECDVWVENQRAEKVIVGKASGLVPR